MNPKVNPYPLFGSDNFSYLHTVLRYNGIKAGYDIKILSFKYPDYEPVGSIGIQSKVRQQGKWSKYTSLLLPTEKEHLAFEIQVPVKAKVLTDICAEIFPYADPTFDLNNKPIYCHQPIAWFNKTGIDIESEKMNGLVTGPLNRRTEDDYNYSFVNVRLTNLLDGSEEHKRYEENPYAYKEGNERFLQDILEEDFKVHEDEGKEINKIFILRTKITTTAKDGSDRDYREDSILLEIKPG